jgi:hypothetical protein
MNCNYLAIIAIVFILLPSLALAYPGPKAYLVEQVSAHYNITGDPDTGTTFDKCDPPSNPCRYGYVQVAPPNNQDVLQYVRINLSGTANTNLQSITSYAGVVANSTAYERVDIYVNTSDADPDDAYEITGTDVAPVIELNLTTLTNWEGGYDLYDADNIYPDGISNPANTMFFNFSITNPSTTKSLTGAQVTIQFNNTNPDAVAIDSGSVGQTGGSASSSNGGGAAGHDRVIWNGDLSTNNATYVWFNATIQEGTNFNGDSVSLDDSDTDTKADYDEAATTLTARTITGRFCRGPIRQGVDLAEEPGSGAWKIRGFITNIGTTSGDYLRYNVTSWSVYQINPSTGVPMTPANQSGDFNEGAATEIITASDGRIYTTDATRSSNKTWYNSTLTSKPYYGIGFEWHVEWNSTSESGFINTTLDLTTLYKIDMVNSKNIQGAISPDTGGENLTITDNSQHTGHDNTPADFIEIMSVVPHKTTLGQDHGLFTIHEDEAVDLHVYYVNSTGGGTAYEIQGASYESEVTQPTESSDGLVRINISDVSSAALIGGGTIGHDLADDDGSNDETIRLVFKVTSNSSMTTGDNYEFSGNTTFKTPSTTPLTEVLQNQTASVSAKQLTGWKQLKGFDVNNPTLINATIVVETYTESSSSKIQGIRFLDYIPNGTDIDGDIAALRQAVKLTYYNGTGPYTLVDGTDFNISWNGTKTLPDGLVVNAYEFWNTTGDSSDNYGFRLGNLYWINVSYQMNVTGAGLYVLPTMISGFDPLTGTEFSVEAIGAVTVEIPEPLLPLEIDEGDFTQAKWAVVNNPVLWMKDFEVYNPNGRPAKSKFSIDVFEDTSMGYVSYYNEYGKKVEEEVDFIISGGSKRMVWESVVNPFESRSYEVRTLTPPVMEVDRNVEVLEKLAMKKVKIMMDVFLKNFGKEEYENVVLNLPIGFENMIQARDSFGHELQFSGGRDSSRVMVGDMKADAMKSVNIIYKQSYPTIIVTPEKNEFTTGSPVGLNILVINGGEEIKYPYLEIEIYTPGMDVIESDILKIESMEPLEKTELTEKYFLPISAPTGMYLASVSFRKDFVTLASGTGQFFLTGGEAGLSQTWGWILLMIVIILMGMLSFKRIESVKKGGFRFKK